MKNMRGIKCSLIIFIISLLKLTGQSLTLTIDDTLARIYETDSYKLLVVDSLINQYNNRLFDIKILPTLNLNATLPSLTKSINSITQDDGSDKYINKFSSTSKLNLSASQLIPFTGGTISVNSYLNRLDNYNPSRSQSYNLNLFDVSYEQSITGFNDYKWEKLLHNKNIEIVDINYLQDIEAIKLDAIDLFFNLYTEQKYCDLKASSIELSRTIFEKSRILYTEGKLSEEDFLEAEIDYLTELTQNNLNRYFSARDEFKNFFSIADSLDITLEIDYHAVDTWMKDIDIERLIERALFHNVELNYEYEKLSLESELRRAKSNLAPKINFSLGSGINSTSPSLSNIMMRNNNKFNAILNVSMPILDWGKNKIARNIIYERITKLDINRSVTLNRRSISHFEDLQNYSRYIDEIKYGRDLVTLSNRRLELYKINLEHQKIDITNYINTRNQLIRNELHLISTINSLYLMVYKYRRDSLIDMRTGSEIEQPIH